MIILTELFRIEKIKLNQLIYSHFKISNSALLLLIFQ